jgi:hypothetical protein
MPVPNDWADGDTVHGSDLNVIADQVNANTTAVSAATTALTGKAPVASTQLYGSGAPTSGLGIDGDTYTDYTNAKKYTKTAGAWSVTTDTTVSKEIILAGTWSNSGGTLSNDTSDGMTEKKIVTTLNTDAFVTFTITTAVNMTNKMLRIPVRMDQVIDGWASNIGELKISDTNTFGPCYIHNFNSKDVLRANEVEAWTCCPNLGFIQGSPNLASAKYLRFWFKDNNSAVRTAYLGNPVLIG